MIEANPALSALLIKKRHLVPHPSAFLKDAMFFIAGDLCQEPRLTGWLPQAPSSLWLLTPAVTMTAYPTGSPSAAPPQSRSLNPRGLIPLTARMATGSYMASGATPTPEGPLRVSQ